MKQRWLIIRYACPVDPDLELAWPDAHSREAYLASQSELNETDPMAQARRSIVTTLTANHGEPVTADACWSAYLGEVRGETLELEITHVHVVAFAAAVETVMFAAKYNTNRRPEVILSLDDAIGYTDFRERFQGNAPSSWDGRIEHSIARNLIALLEIYGSVTRNGAFRVIVEAFDEISTTGGQHIQATTRRILDGFLTELFPSAFPKS